MKKIYDISPTISPKLSTFPGDTPFFQKFLLSYEKNHHIDLSTITMTTHMGAHTDAPRHYHPEGGDIASQDLDIYLGTAQVIQVDKKRGELIEPQDLVDITASRVIFKTDCYPDWNQWYPDFMGISQDTIHQLADAGVILVGIDTPSIDPADSKTMDAHKAVYQRQMAILEGVDLKNISPGLYELIALPLKIANGDASPVRAILREI